MWHRIVDNLLTFLLISRSEMILLHSHANVRLPGIITNRVDFHGCTAGLMKRLLGVEICTQASYPNASEFTSTPNFPLTGPSHFSVKLQKSDALIKSYNFLHKIVNDSNNKAWNLSFKPEGSAESKEVGLRASIDLAKGELSVTFSLPTRTYTIAGKLICIFK